MKITEANKKFQIYNSLFLNLYYNDSNHIGYLLPLFKKYASKGIEKQNGPVKIIDQFFEQNAEGYFENKIDFMFKVIQYVERQIVLFDSIEDSTSPYELEDQQVVRISELLSDQLANAHVEEVMKKLNDFRIRIVLTAHPTQFYRPPVLDIISNLREQISNNDIQEVDTLLHQLGLTSLVNSKSPTPLEEAKNIIHICRTNYYNAIGDFQYQLIKNNASFVNQNLITLGFWPCGDRDGNPYVTHKTTKEVMDTLRMTLMKCYYNDLKVLISKLTFKEAEVILYELKDKLYTSMFEKDHCIDHKEILNKLEEVEKIIVNHYESLYLEDLHKYKAKVSVFRNHFASLDIRQDHSVHVNTVTYILKENGYIKDSIDEIDKNKLVELLTGEYLDIPNDIQVEDSRVADTILNIAQLDKLQELNGEDGCHRYIISNSEDIFSVLFVLGLMRWIGKKEVFNFDIIPLFETMNGMAACEEIMETLFETEAYKTQLKYRKNKQTIMLGFSDGTKDGGYLKANWSIFKSKEVLTAACKRYDVSVVFFDGRGGPPARGGGKTHNFYAALGSGIANDEVQMTIQGQTITSTYGTEEKFKFNAEQLITSGLLGNIDEDKNDISTDQRSLIEELSELSYEKYIDLKNHPRFLSYLEEMTTLKYYSAANIGSRPSKRNADKKLTLSDLRAISYVGSWSQLKQNIPGYFGIGTALEKVKKSGRLEELKKLYKEVRFFKILIDNSMMSLTKCFFEITSYMKENDTYRDFWIYLYDEYVLSKQMTLEITGFDTLMENEQRTKASIRIREELVLPLILIQNYALQKVQSGDEQSEVYKKLVIRSLYGNINASRNSA
jgi:phosphoenolpyruvate carboxylase